jgi:hypothetical protein
MLRSPVASRFGPDSPPGSSSQSPRLLSLVQQVTRHSPVMNAAALHHSASTAVRLPKSAQRIPSVQVPPSGPSGQDKHGWLLKADHTAEMARTIKAVICLKVASTRRHQEVRAEEEGL